MKSVISALIILMLFAGLVEAQTVLNYRNDPVVRKSLGPATPPGVVVLDQSRRSAAGWWTVIPPGTSTVDWGYINAVDTNNLPDEVISGFTFEYVTNDVSTDGLTFGLFIWDQATGWGDPAKVQEWGIIDSGFPNMRNVPGSFVSWTITFDLTGDDFSASFLLDKGDAVTAPRDGIEYGLWSYSTDLSPNAVIGWSTSLPPAPAGQNNSQADDAVSTVYDDYSWFGGYVPGGPGVGGRPFASMIWKLYALGGPAVNTKYMGIGKLRGNEAALYTAGDWAIGGNCHFIMRMNGMTQQPILSACVKLDPKYSPVYDVHKIFPMPIPWRKVMVNQQTASGAFDYATYNFANLGAKIATKSIFFQGIITDKFNGGMLAPIDLSRNAVKTN